MIKQKTTNVLVCDYCGGYMGTDVTECKICKKDVCFECSSDAYPYICQIHEKESKYRSEFRELKKLKKKSLKLAEEQKEVYNQIANLQAKIIFKE